MRHLRYLVRPLVLAGMLCCGLAAAQQQAAPPTVAVNIEPQPIRKALEKFADQTGLQVVLRDEEFGADGVIASRVVGELSVEQALGRLLAGTDLRYEFVNARTVKISRQEKTKALQPAAQEIPGQALAAPIRMARVDEEREKAQTGAEETSSEERGAPEILVKGKRSINTDIRRTEDDPQPVVVFDREEIQRSQAINMEDFLKKRLPMNAVEDTPSQSNTGSSALAISAINLRGLGTDQTLILVDGRRMPGVSVFGNPVQSDINGIPMASVERIEVLPSTAGGIYGGSATGGVINIITRKDYSGVEGNATYANTFDTDTGSVRLDANAGFSLENGRTQVTVTATHSQSNTMVMGDRDFAERGVALQRQNYPELIGTGVPLGGTVNIQSALIVGGVRQPLTLDAGFSGGASLGRTFTHLPLGYAGPASDGGAALLANAGSYNLDMPAGLAGRDRGMLATPSTLSASVNVRREFTPRLDVFVDFSHFGSKGSLANAGAPTSVTNIPASAPNNPFQQPINVRFPTPNLGFQSESESTTLRATGGLIARLPREWTTEVDLAWSRSRLKMTGAQTLVDTTTTTVLRSGLPAPDGRPALNALQEANTFPLDFTPYLLPVPGQIFGPYDTVMKNATLRLTGPVLRLPAGALWLSALVERREEEVLDGFTSRIDSTTRDWTYDFYPRSSQDVDSIYLEARVPLLRQLEAQLSARRDDYRTRAGSFGGVPVSSPDDPLPQFDYQTNKLSSTDYTAALRYAPSEDLALRMSIGTGFLPPTVAQIVPATFDFDSSFGLLDPRRGFTDTYVGEPFGYIYGGYAGLNPEQSRSWSAGFILTPRIAPDLRVSVDYTRIEKVDEISSPEMQFLLDNEALLPGRITRGPNLGTDPTGWAGPITAFNLGYINIANTKLEAFDIQADYTVGAGDRGEFRWYLMATWTPHYLRQAFPNVPEQENAGYSSAPLKWRGNFGLEWTRGAMSIGWNTQYFSSYIGYWASSDEFFREEYALSNGGPTVESQMYHDLIVSWRTGTETASFGGGIFANTDLSVGIQNLLDTSPPILATPGPLFDRAYSAFGDPRLRRYTISLRKSFE